MKDGVIADFKVTEKMLNYFIRRRTTARLLGASAHCMACYRGARSPQGRERAVMDSAYRAKASEVHLVEQAMVAAIGSGSAHH